MALLAGAFPSFSPVLAARDTRGKGFWEGFGIGAGAGFLTGVVIGAVWHTTCRRGRTVDGETPTSCPISQTPNLG